MVGYVWTLGIMSVLLFSMCCILLVHGGYFNKILVKLGLKEAKAKINWTVFSWNNTMEKLDYQADIVFFGDSLVRGSDFRSVFKDKRIVNLGCSGDTLAGMIERVSMVKAMSPKKVFFLGGINGLTNKNVEVSVNTYSRLLDKLHSELPESEIYVHSLLPLSREKERSICKNETIVRFNERIEAVSKEKGFSFVDLYSLYLLDGEMNPALTKDGIHLLPDAYDIWARAIEKHIKEE